MSINSILVVDDTLTDLTNIRDIVSDAGFKVITASNGKEALQKAKAEEPDLIFMDIIMPEMDGYETCRRLAGDEQTKNIPVVFVSSKNQKADKVWAKMQGGKSYVTKPYSADEIVDQIKTFQ
jgi:twitching motility two-component system response regulator PilH